MDSQGSYKPVPPKPARNYQVPYHVFASNSAPTAIMQKDRRTRFRLRKSNIKLPENFDDGFTDRYGNVIRITGEKRKAVEAAVEIVCSDLEQIVPADFVPDDWKQKFDTLLRQHVRGIMYTLMAPQPLMSPAKYVQLYQITNPPSKNTSFMKSMRDRLVNLIKNAPKPAYQPTSEDEAEYGDESIENIKDDPNILGWIKQTAHNNCWYMDYILGKVLTKAVKTVRSENLIEDITKNIPVETNKPKDLQSETEEALIQSDNATETDEITSITENAMENEEIASKTENAMKNEEIAIKTENAMEEITTENKTTMELVPANPNDMSSISFPQLLEKINQADDMEPIIRFIDLRLARMASRIRQEIVWAATRGPGLVVLHPRMKQLGLDGLQLKTPQKLHYATMVTHTNVTSELMKKYSIAASWQTKPFKKIKYSQTNVAILGRSPFKHLLARHMKYFQGYKMAAIRSFPPDEEDLKNEEEDRRREKEAKKLAMEIDEDEELPPELY